MKIYRHKKFKKQYQKLPKLVRGKTDFALKKFIKNPFDPTLKNHPLKGHLKPKRAFSVTGNIRVVFEEYDNYAVILMLDVGNHPRVYGM